MMLRPRARRRPVDPVDLEALADEIAHATFVWGPPQAVALGTREWTRMRAHPDARKFLGFWPGGEATFNSIPLVVRPDLRAPKVLQTPQDMQEALQQELRR